MITTNRSYYACSYPYGVASNADTGRRLCTYYRFDSRAERDAWVSDGDPYRGARGYRQSIRAGDSDLRHALRREEREYGRAGVEIAHPRDWERE